MPDRPTADTITDDALDVLHQELAGARATIDHMSKAMSWICGHDRQGLDHLEEAQREARGREAAVRQAQSWAARARSAEAARDGAYRERARLVAHLAALYPSTIGLTDPNAPDWAVVTIETPAGQMCWHIATADYDLFEHVERSLDARWDGHTTDEKYERLRQLTASAKWQPDRVITFDRVLTEQECEEFKVQWAKAHGGGRQNHAGPITTGPSAKERPCLCPGTGLVNEHVQGCPYEKPQEN